MDRNSKTRGYALEARLIGFAAGVCKDSKLYPDGPVGGHLRAQIIRAATSPAANYAEARAAQSHRDFIHKMQLCLKELRETSVWLRLGDEVFNRDSTPLSDECDELISIMVASIRTARQSQRP